MTDRPLRHAAVVARRRSGLTLLELMVSSVLAVLLMLALTALLQTVAAQRRAGDSPSRPAAQRLGELLRRDMLNARHIRLQPTGIQLAGLMGHASGTRVPTLRPATATYLVTDNGWLLRRETPLDETRPARVDLLWAGAQGIEVVVYDEPDEEPAPSSVPGMTRMPTHLQVTVRGADGQPVCREEIVHHMEY